MLPVPMIVTFMSAPRRSWLHVPAFDTAGVGALKSGWTTST